MLARVVVVVAVVALAEEVAHVVVAEVASGRGVVDDGPPDAHLEDLALVHLRLHRVVRHEAVDGERLRLAVAERAADRLRVHRRVPRHVHQDHVVRGHQIQPERAGARREQEELRLGPLVEGVAVLLAHLLRRGPAQHEEVAVAAPAARPGHGVRDVVQRRERPGEAEDLVAVGDGAVEDLEEERDLGRDVAAVVGRGLERRGEAQVVVVLVLLHVERPRVAPELAADLEDLEEVRARPLLRDVVERLARRLRRLHVGAALLVERQDVRARLLRRRQ